ncbi:Soluble lytic murein transglycosylase [BD1-7 clade bacterium]|uniref:Soluble lytic murein transglycosylase n=1 Tax=BD1-7 clade bacterium TaxID=2029982 RepID=A0A5S9Q105_9GAMM|nr:Soluble lytic murein transglycosylase [BD1-7 clade bacterium]CAA0112203.1 Soluble lytic murein transglycosylase [BD1-7 clade bacterium]
MTNDSAAIAAAKRAAMKVAIQHASITIKVICLTLFATTVWGSTSPQSAFVYPDYREAREVYQQARKALKQKKVSRYQKLRADLDNYPLAPYLDVLFLRSQFTRNTSNSAFDDLHNRVNQWITENSTNYLTPTLRNHWLNYLAVEGHWEEFTHYYIKEEATESNRCFAAGHHIRTLTNTKSSLSDEAWLPVTALWLSPRSVSKTCDSVFARWKKSGQLTPAVAWQRYQLALNAGQHTLAKYLRSYLSKDDASLSLKLASPKRYTAFWFDAFSSNIDTLAINSNLTSDSIKRVITRLLPDHGEHLRPVLMQATIPGLTPAHHTRSVRLAAWYLLKDNPDSASDWLDDVEHQTPDVTTFQLRTAIVSKNWGRYQWLYQQASTDLQQLPEWRYWYARAQRNTGLVAQKIEERPRAIFEQLAKERHFWGFITAEAAKQAYPVGQADELTHPPSEAVVQAIMPAIELHILKRPLTSENEWTHATRDFTPAELKQAARAASHFNMHDKAFRALAGAQAWDALEQRFPLMYMEHFTKHSEKHALNPFWLLAMARQESAFSPHAQSSVGARGVLQLMPATARKVARSLQVPYSRERLSDPAYNIALGSRYLKDLLKTFDNNYVLATAAYNAGPHRVKRWLEDQPMTEDWVHWVSTIPYKETRKYVTNILTYSLIYQTRARNAEFNLADFVPPADSGLPES